MPRVPLPILDARIEERASATRSAHDWWPCSKGCDLCCRSLPHLPTITEAEWHRLRDALALLPADVQADIARRVDAEAQKPTGPVTCPMLDREHGACRVYAARPIACRTYGFYTDRDAGLHCNDITRLVDAHAASATILWGNGEGITADLAPYGEPASLAHWMNADHALSR